MDKRTSMNFRDSIMSLYLLCVLVNHVIHFVLSFSTHKA